MKTFFSDFSFSTRAFLLVLCVLLLCLTGCGTLLPNSPIHTMDLSQYGKWNQYVQDRMKNKSLDFFPNVEAARNHGVSYEYEFYEPLFGDVHWFIALKVEGESFIQEEIERLSLNEKVKKKTKGGYLIYLEGREESFDLYTDDNRAHPVPFFFGAVLLEEDGLHLNYLSAEVWDQQVPVEPVISFLERREEWTLFYNGEQIDTNSFFDPEGTIMVPVAALLEAMGADVQWDKTANDYKVASVWFDGQSYVLDVGAKQMKDGDGGKLFEILPDDPGHCKYFRQEIWVDTEVLRLFFSTFDCECSFDKGEKAVYISCGVGE